MRSRPVPLGRWVALVGAVVLFLEAVGIALLNWFLGMVVDRQDMSLAGLDPRAMTVSTWIAGVLFGLYLALCGLVLLFTALRDRGPSGLGRILLISAAVVHGALGAFCVGIVGWSAFVFMMIVLGLIVLTLMAYEAPGGAAEQGAATGGTPGQGTAEGGAPQPV
ncbi:hypothetical protein ACFVT5_02480 [Streptomyces sp. NPDC058001]|uniref:hypothetical protein n=1 Tax=Streptomyces sp. NPDC058001 TaxID=3346300 RepID=UPI0036EC48DB